MGHWFQKSSYVPKDARRARWALSRVQRQLTVAQLGSTQCRLRRQSRRQKAMMPQPRRAHLASLSRGRPSDLVCRRRPSAIYARLGVVRRRSATSRHACCRVFWPLDKSRAIPTQGAPNLSRKGAERECAQTSSRLSLSLWRHRGPVVAHACFPDSGPRRSCFRSQPTPMF